MKPSAHRSVITIISLVMVVNALSYGIIIPLLYPFASRYGISATGLGILFASFSLAQFIATPIIGRLSDKYGRKPLLLLSLFGTAVSLFLFASAQSVIMLFVARIADGITGGNISVAQAMLADVTTPEDRAKTFGILGALFGVGFVAGPAAGALLSHFGLTVPFYFASGLALVGTILGVFLLKETNTSRETKSGGDLFAIGALKKAFTSPVVGPILFISLITLTSQNAMIIGFQSFTVDILALDPTHIGIIFTLFGLITIFIQGFGLKWLLSKFRLKRHLLELLLALSALTMVAVAATSTYWWFVITILTYGVFSSPLPAILTAMISEKTNPEDQGGILGVNQSLTSLGQIVGPLISAALVAYHVRLSFLATAALLLASLLLTTAIARRSRSLDL